jgi:hypothetical protein
MPVPLLLRGLWGWRRGLAVAALLLWAVGAATVLAIPRAHVAQAVVAPAETTSFAVSSLLSPSPFAPGGLLDTRPTGNFAIYLGAKPRGGGDAGARDRAAGLDRGAPPRGIGRAARHPAGRCR